MTAVDKFQLPRINTVVGRVPGPGTVLLYRLVHKYFIYLTVSAHLYL